MKNASWTRRRFLGAALAIPAIACGDTAATPDAGAAADAGDSGTSPDVGALDSGLDAPPDAPAVDEHPCPDSFPRIDLKKDCGAAGDGVTNDTAALQKAASIIQTAGGGELTIPPGVYIIGSQKKKTSGTGPYYVAADLFTVHDLACLKISGYGATLRVAAGLRYGGFDPTTGQPSDFPSGGTANAATVGHVFSISSSTNVLVEGVEVDGSNESLVLGGQWGDVDRQAAATGLLFNKCDNVTVVDVHTHHHGLDGIAVEYQPGAPPKKMPHELERVVSEYNGRQGLSWIGGWGLTCTDCKFNHTGRAMNGGKPMTAKPGDGLDIEPNRGTTEQSREGVFTGCEFIDNIGNGIEAANGDGGYSTFDKCTIWGTTNYSMWVVKPGMKFTSCNIYGTLVRGSDGSTATNSAPDASLATQFVDCTFEDKEWTDGNVFRAGALVALTSGVEGMSWTGCTFVSHKLRSVLTADATTTEIFDSCTFVHGDSGLPSGTYQAQLVGSRVQSCHFEEAPEVSGSGKTYYIDVTQVVVATPAQNDPPTHVDGPQVKWSSTSRLTGDIAPGTYAS